MRKIRLVYLVNLKPIRDSRALGGHPKCFKAITNGPCSTDPYQVVEIKWSLAKATQTRDTLSSTGLLGICNALNVVTPKSASECPCEWEGHAHFRGGSSKKEKERKKERQRRGMRSMMVGKRERLQHFSSLFHEWRDMVIESIHSCHDDDAFVIWGQEHPNSWESSRFPMTRGLICAFESRWWQIFFSSDFFSVFLL